LADTTVRLRLGTERIILNERLRLLPRSGVTSPELKDDIELLLARQSLFWIPSCDEKLRRSFGVFESDTWATTLRLGAACDDRSGYYLRASGVDNRLLCVSIVWFWVTGTSRFLTTLLTTVRFFLALCEVWSALGFFVLSWLIDKGVSLGWMIKLLFMAGSRFFYELLKVACLSRLSGDGCTMRPRLPSSRPTAVHLPPLELVSKGRLFLRWTCSDR